MVILQFILAFAIMMALHETGHFILSKLFGIDVEEFGLGLPPRICRLFTWKGTEFTLNWIPFGAFVRPKGEFDADSQENSLRSAPAWKQICILFGGPIMNLLTAVVLFGFCVHQLGIADISKVYIDKVEPDSPAETAGLRPGDRLISAAGTPLTAFDQVSTVIDAHLDEEIPLEIARGEESLTLSVTPLSNPPEGRGAMGVVITYGVTDASLWESVRFGFENTGFMVKQYVIGLGQMISGQMEMGLESIVGPVGMFSFYEDAAKTDKEEAEAAEAHLEELEQAGADTSQRMGSTVQSAWLNRLNFFALISVCLGVTNLFPIPGLDGGRILFLLPELIFRKKVPLRVETFFNGLFMTLLLLLMAVVMFKDIWMLGK